MATDVDDLINIPFQPRPTHIKIQIFLRGRPRPYLEGVFDRTGNHLVPFDLSAYNRTEWLTASEKRKKLFCWTCLLFGKPNEWNTSGVHGENLEKRAASHQVDGFHIKALLMMQCFRRDHFVPVQQDVTLYNKLVQRNHVVLKRLIDAVTFAVLQKKPPVRNSETVDHLTVGDCVEALNFLSVCGFSGDDASITEDSVFLLENDDKMLNCIVDSITNVLRFAIKREAHASAFVSLVLSGHGYAYSTRQVLQSTVLRFLKNGKVCERFIGFHTLENVKCRLIYQHLSKVLCDYQLSQRVLSVSIDGTFPFSIVDSINTEISSMYPYVSFVPCYFHKMWDVLVDVLSNCYHADSERRPSHGLYFVETNLFFKMMESMVFFLQKHFDDFNDFNDLLAESSISFDDRPKLETFDSVNNPHTLRWVKVQRKNMIHFFNQSIKHCDNSKTDDYIKICAFQSFLTQFDTVFWILFFIKLFSLTKDAHAMLDRQTPDTPLVTSVLEKVLGNLGQEKESGFEPLWREMMDYAGTDMVLDLDRYCRCKNMFKQSIGCVSVHISGRMEHLKSLAFFKLLNPSHFYPAFEEPHELIDLVIKSYGDSFNLPALKKEARALYTDNREILGYSLEQLLEYMTRYESRKSQFRYLIKLAELVLTMNCIRPSNGHEPVINAVKAYSPSFTPHSVDCSMLCVERELFEDIRLRKSFYEDVIQVFSKHSKNLDMLQFKR